MQQLFNTVSSTQKCVPTLFLSPPGRSSKVQSVRHKYINLYDWLLTAHLTSPPSNNGLITKISPEAF